MDLSVRKIGDRNEVAIGQVLPKEIWLSVRDDLIEAFSAVADLLLKRNYEGKGEQYANEFLAEAQLAINAMTYVGEFAADKCRFIILPDLLKEECEPVPKRGEINKRSRRTKPPFTTEPPTQNPNPSYKPPIGSTDDNCPFESEVKK